jgi:hypothetical protein
MQSKALFSILATTLAAGPAFALDLGILNGGAGSLVSPVAYIVGTATSAVNATVPMPVAGLPSLAPVTGLVGTGLPSLGPVTALVGTAGLPALAPVTSLVGNLGALSGGAGLPAIGNVTGVLSTVSSLTGTGTAIIPLVSTLPFMLPALIPMASTLDAGSVLNTATSATAVLSGLSVPGLPALPGIPSLPVGSLDVSSLGTATAILGSLGGAGLVNNLPIMPVTSTVTGAVQSVTGNVSAAMNSGVGVVGGLPSLPGLSGGLPQLSTPVAHVEFHPSIDMPTAIDLP